MNRKFLCLVAALMTLAALAGCGYHSRGLFPPNVRTIQVNLFENLDRRARDFEALLQKALVTEIENRTPYRVVTGTQADTFLAGRIEDSRAAPISEGLNNEIRESAVEFVLTFSWIDQRSNRPLIANRVVTGARPVVVSRGETVASRAGQIARDLAAKIVRLMELSPPPAGGPGE